MRRKLVFVQFVALLMAFSCNGSTGPDDFPHAVATPLCGPADGPATGLLLARNPIQSLTPDYPYLRVNIWQPVMTLSGKTYEIGDDSGELTAQYYTAPGEFENAVAGSVRISRVGDDRSVRGTLALRFPSRFASEGFSALWLESLMLCG
ncbi:MAG TPA: hypothetical protein VFP37_01540 [Steroidobacteraceae bacterium]|nr:hypothetical protein [Steroidobacteraceae bacterium]